MDEWPRDAALGVVVTLLMAASPVLGQTPWQVATRVDPATGAESRSASTQNAEGFRLVVSSAAGSRSARCSLQLPEGGSATLDTEKHPTLMVDGRAPQPLAPWPASEADEADGGDFMEVARRAIGVVPLIGMTSRSFDFRCWTALKDQVAPTHGALRQMIDGDQLIVAFQLASGDAAEASFSLAGAGAVLAEALGRSLEPTEKDHLQDELLRFRVQYRKSTCFLLPRKKRVQACVEAVNQCALRSHESVLAMLGCIEGE